MSEERFGVRDLRDDAPVFIHSEVDDLGLDPYEFRVYCRFARRGAGGSWESVANMAQTLKMCAPKVREAIAALVSMGMVERKDVPGKPSVFHLTPRSKWRRPETVQPALVDVPQDPKPADREASRTAVALVAILSEETKGRKFQVTGNLVARVRGLLKTYPASDLEVLVRYICRVRGQLGAATWLSPAMINRNDAERHMAAALVWHGSESVATNPPVASADAQKSADLGEWRERFFRENGRAPTAAERRKREAELA